MGNNKIIGGKIRSIREMKQISQEEIEESLLKVVMGVEKKSLVKAEEEAIYKEAEGEGKKTAEETFFCRTKSYW